MSELNRKISEMRGFHWADQFGNALYVPLRADGDVTPMVVVRDGAARDDNVPRWTDDEALCMTLFEELAEGRFVSLKTVEGGWSVLWDDKCDAHVMLDADRRRTICKAWIEWKEGQDEA